jgi:ATP adenylyltransferase
LDRLWAPWRIGYVLSDKPEGCIFCDKPLAGDDAANHIVWRGERAFVMLNMYPYNNCHMLIAPFAHVADLEALSPETLLELMTLSQKAVHALKTHLSPHGVNLGVNLGEVAGAGVADHLHMHVVPRWSGDTNFMTVTADTRVISQSLDEAYKILHAAFL